MPNDDISIANDDVASLEGKDMQHKLSWMLS